MAAVASQEIAAVGFDFGTSSSCVSVFRNGSVDVVANAQGHRTTPSVIGFTDVEQLVGNSAENQRLKNYKNTVFGVKTLLGRKFGEVGDFDVPFTVVDKNGEYAVEVELKGKNTVFTATELAAELFKELKATAEQFTGLPVTEAVITVPSNFDDAQREAVVAAAKLAGVEVSRMLTEPVAAAIAYGLDTSVEDGGKSGSVNALVFDLGARSCEVSIINVQDGIFTTKANAFSSKVGGNYFDQCLMEHFVKVFEKDSGVNVLTEASAAKARRRLQKNCGEAKVILSASGEAHIELDALHEGIDLFDSVTEARFMGMCRKGFTELTKPIKEALAQANMTKADISEILLVGGCSKIPKVQQAVSRFFRGNANVNETISPDEAVAYGAAVQAGLLVGECAENSGKTLVLDMAPLTIGLKTASGILAPVIASGATIPCSRTVTFATSEDNQKSVFLEVYEGERARAEDNRLLGRFELSGIAPAPAGTTNVDVIFSLNAEGQLDISATAGDASCKLSVTSDQQRASEADVKKAREEAVANLQKDAEYTSDVAASAAFVDSLQASLSRAEALKGDDKTSMTKMVTDAQKWLASQDPASSADCASKEDAIAAAFQDIVDRINNVNLDDDLDDLDDLDDDDLD